MAALGSPSVARYVAYEPLYLTVIDKYLHILEERIMDNVETDDHTDARREIIRYSLNEITTDLETELRKTGLHYPVYLIAPNSGNVFATIATPVDPPDEDWSRMVEILCRIMGKRLGGIRLCSRPLLCAGINTAISTADVISD
jgi:hypothetical protein